ncbi:MAG: PD-(D/E)XK nuclease family protein [Chlamydiales bacterium]
MKTKVTFDPSSEKSFKLSRSKIDLYCECPRCFYLDRRLGVTRPPGFPFNLNSAVDHLLKKEFDSYRTQGLPHPLMTQNNVAAIPFTHEKIDEWRNNRKGITFLHKATNFLVYGSIDDLWLSPSGELIVVDYKATSKKEEVTLDSAWQDGYKRQIEIYQWLFRQNGFNVSNTGYFVYCNGKKDREQFGAKLDFDISVLPYVGNDSWIEPKLIEIRQSLDSNALAEPSPECDYCSYRAAASNLEGISRQLS